MFTRVVLTCGILFVVTAVLVTGLSDAGVTQSKGDSVTLKKLEERIALEARVARLEDQISGVQQAAGVVPPSTVEPRPLHEADDETVRRKGSRREINGIPFYTLPLKHQSRAK